VKIHTFGQASRPAPEIEGSLPSALAMFSERISHRHRRKSASSFATVALPASQAAYFSDRGRLFQADRGRRNVAVGDALGKRASSGLNVSQSSTISLKRVVVGPVIGLGFGLVDF